jgi:hypothetical protein
MFRLRISAVMRPYISANVKRKLHICEHTYNYTTVNTHNYTTVDTYNYKTVDKHNYTTVDTHNYTTVDTHIIIQL